MELEQDRINLIKRIITSDRKYANNEDLFEDFLNETYKRSFLIMKTVKSEAALESYLKKIVTTSIINVLKDSGRVQRTSEGFVATQEKPIEEIIPQILEINNSKYADVNINYDIVDLRDGPEEIIIKKETLQTLLDAITIAHNNDPSKQYMQLYQLRFVKEQKQKQIAKELNISQSEVSKRLFEMMEEVKKIFNQS